MATITKYETKAGPRYRVRYRKPDGAQTDKRGFVRKKDAAAFAATVETSKLRGEFIGETEGRRPVAEFAGRWLEHKSIRKPAYVQTLNSTWRVHVEPRWGSVAVGNVRRSDVQSWVSRLALERSASVVHRAHDILAGALDVAVDDRAMLTNPARGVKLPTKRRGAHDYLTLEQVRALADEAGANGPLVWFLATTGLRWGEACALQGKHLQRAARRVRVERSVTRVAGEMRFGTPKDDEPREVPITETVLGMLPLVMPHALVWPDPHTGDVRRPQKTTGWFAGAVKRCRARDDTFPPVTPHDLRHTAASLAVSAGANVKAVQRMLGHASAAMTLDIYADLFDGDLDLLVDRLEQHIREAS